MINDSIQYETRTPPNDSQLLEAAKTQPRGWVYDVDYKYPDDQPTPPESIRGAWEIDDQGAFTGRYRPNHRYRAINRSQRALKPYMHAGARTNKNQWIVEIDPRGEASFPDVPQNMVRGWWFVDKDGNITDQFRPNSLWIDDSVEVS